jgi:RecA/RadA recombinase
MSLKALKKVSNFVSLDELTEIQYVPTGIIGLDYLLGGGLPLGRALEIYGGTNLGKSTVAIWLCNALLTANERSECLYVDVEKRLGKYHFERIVSEANRDRIQISQGNDLKRDIIRPMMYLADECDKEAEGAYGIDPTKTIAFVIDSLPFLNTEELQERIQSENKEFESRAPGSALSRALANAIGAFTAFASSYANGTTIFINHESDKLNPYSSDIPRPGGQRYKQLAANAIRLSGNNKEEKDTTGITVTTLRSTKASGAPANRTAVMAISYKHGIEPRYSLYHLLMEGDLKDKVIKANGRTYEFPVELGLEPLTNITKAKFYTYLLKEDEVYNKLYYYVLENFCKSSPNNVIEKDIEEYDE